jgi:hypothetical protein
LLVTIPPDVLMSGNEPASHLANRRSQASTDDGCREEKDLEFSWQYLVTALDCHWDLKQTCLGYAL